MQSRHRLVQTQHVRPQAARGSAARCSCTALRRRLHPYHGSAGTRASASLVAVGSFVVASALLIHRQSFHFDTEDTGPAYTQVQIQHRSRAPGPPVKRDTLWNHTQTHIHIHKITSHTKAGPARGRLCGRAIRKFSYRQKDTARGSRDAHDLPVLYCTVPIRHIKTVCVNVKVCHCVMLVYSSNNTQNH